MLGLREYYSFWFGFEQKNANTCCLLPPGVGCRFTRCVPYARVFCAPFCVYIVYVRFDHLSGVRRNETTSRTVINPTSPHGASLNRMDGPDQLQETGHMRGVDDEGQISIAMYALLTLLLWRVIDHAFGTFQPVHQTHHHHLVAAFPWNIFDIHPMLDAMALLAISSFAVSYFHRSLWSLIFLAGPLCFAYTAMLDTHNRGEFDLHN